MVLTESVRLEPGTYFLPKGIRVESSGVRVEGVGVKLVGMGEGAGVSMLGVSGVEIVGLQVCDFYHGIYARNCDSITIADCKVSGTAEVAPNTVFLDIWLPAEKAYGGGVCLIDCKNCEIVRNDLQHQMNGLLTYGCERLQVTENQCSYNSGFGIHLYQTRSSVFERNCCDYCCRFEPREGGLHFGHMGADAAGFLAVMNSCDNRFIRNTARMSGDGFFLAGLSPSGDRCGCDRNLFEENDASLSPNIAFEATFCENNIFRNNFADRCNYGFWSGFSKGFFIEGNRMLFNRQAGIAVENGTGFTVSGNRFQENGHGILLWSRQSSDFSSEFPDRTTSHNWLIEANTFHKNGKGIRIAAGQDHGIRPLQEGSEFERPHSHTIMKNDIQRNRVGIELCSADRNIVRENTLNANVECDLRLEDSNDNEIVNNLGARGAYL